MMQVSEQFYHQPVMLAECLEGLSLKKDGIYIDATFGGGGHSKAILGHLSSGKLIAFDKDDDSSENIISDDNLMLVKDDFRNMDVQLSKLGIENVDGILADLGVSSHQFDSPSRGFSIRFDDEELDMRMDQEQQVTASMVLNSYDEARLADVFYNYGEFHESRRIASAICKARMESKIKTTGQLKKVLEHMIPRKDSSQYIARIFQAIRIEVNDELGALEDLLQKSSQLLVTGGRLVVISYHSLEDRMVKNYISFGNIKGTDHKDIYGNKEGITMKSVTKKPLTPSDDELMSNTRSRSAKLRVAQRL